MKFYLKTLNCSRDLFFPSDEEIEYSEKPQVKGQKFLLQNQYKERAI